MKRRQDVEYDSSRDLADGSGWDLTRDGTSNPDDRSDLAEYDPTSLELVDEQNTLALYLREVRHIPLLTREQEVHLARQMEQGRTACAELEASGLLDTERRDELIRFIEAGEAARQQLVEANSRLVINLARRYVGRGLHLLDLIQEGYLGLIRAVDKFDYHRGNKLSTYATWWIKHTMSRAVAEHGGTIRLPAHIGDRIRQMAAVSGQLSQELGRSPSHEELASQMGLDTDQVDLMMRARMRPLSFEVMWDEDDGDSAYDAIEDHDAVSPREAISRLDLDEAIDEAFTTLTPREERVLVLRFGLRGSHPHNLDEVGKKFGLTRERIRQIERDALEKLRQPHRRELLEEFVA